MTTRNIVPRADGEGSLGTDTKKWGAVYAEDIHGDLTGNADTATNATNDGNGNEIATTYLPLSGGTVSGTVTFSIGTALRRSNENGLLVITGGFSGGATITLSGKERTTATGEFQLTADNGTTNKTLKGSPDGTLTWDGKEIERVNASGSNYIRYDSGFQICWGSASASSSGAAVTFGAAFSANPRVFVTNSLNVHAYYGNLSTTGATLYNNQTYAANCNYLAIGYWK